MYLFEGAILPTTSAIPCTSWSCLRPLKLVLSLKGWALCQCSHLPFPGPLSLWSSGSWTPIDQQWDSLVEEAPRALGLAALNFRVVIPTWSNAVLVLHGIARRGCPWPGRRMGQPGCLSLARLQLWLRSLTTVPLSCHLSTLQRPPLSSATHHPPSFPACLFEDASFLLPADFSLLSQRWHILFLFNDTDFSEEHTCFSVRCQLPGVPCL